jgi:hypothetical protein
LKFQNFQNDFGTEIEMVDFGILILE